MGALYGGKLPHTPGFIAGGFTAVSSAANKTAFGALLAEVLAFIEGTYIPDAELLASLYGEYFHIGRGPGNLLSFGVFEDGAGGHLLSRGRTVDGTGAAQAVDIAQITEQVTHSWYDDATNNQPPAVGTTVPLTPKPDAYSWLKAPRYADAVYECGPLSRMAVAGRYTRGVSVMDRHLARAHEARTIAVAMQGWLSALPTDAGAFSPFDPGAIANPDTFGLTEAPRGALGHWIHVDGTSIGRYQVITPTCWNCSPRDTAGRPGAMEAALVGTPVARADHPVEVLRVVHSFDPCLDCATHVMRPGEKARVIPLWRPPAPRLRGA
jgi:hydrogenase large subunit